MRQLLPGQQVAVVLQAGDHDAVARPDQFGESRRDQVDRRGGTVGEHHLLRHHAEEARDRGTGAVIGGLGRPRAAMRRAVDVAAGGDLEVALGREHRLGHLRRRRVVEIDETRCREPREQMLHALGVERRRLESGHVRHSS